MFFTLLHKDLKMLLRYKGILIFSFVFLILILALLGFIFDDVMEKNQLTNKVRIGLVSHDKSTATNMLISNFDKDENFNRLFEIKQYSIKEAKEELKKENITGIVEVPGGFAKSLMRYENNKLKVTLNSNDPLKSIMLKEVMESYARFVVSTDVSIYTLYNQMKEIELSDKSIDQINEAFSIEMVFTALSRGKLFSRNEITIIPSSSSIQYFIIAIGVLIIMYIGLIGTNVIIYERDKMCLSRYKVSPSSIMVFIFSKVAALFILSLIQITLLVLPVKFILDIDLSIFTMNSFLFLSISLITIISLSLLLGTFIKTEKIATLVGNVGIFIFGILGGSFIPLKLMPKLIQDISMVTPNHWIIKGFLYVLNGHKLGDIKTSILVLLSASIIFIMLSIYNLKGRRWSY